MFYLEYLIIKAFDIVLPLLSFRIVEYFANFTAFVLRAIFRFRRKVVSANLKRVYGDNLPDNERRLTRNIYRNFVYLWFELIQGKKLNIKNLGRHMNIHNMDIVDAQLKRGKGLILVSGHLGNFEWTMPLFGIKNYDNVVVIMKKLKNPFVNQFMINTREKFGSKTVLKSKAPRAGFKVLHEGGIFAIIGDQDARKKGVFVDLFGLPSSTAVGPAIFHLKTKAPIIFLAIIRRRYGYFDVYFEPVDLDFNLTKSDESIQEVTQKHTQVLEKWILKYPDQWFWMHKRWKTQPKIN